jgi:geranylgeranyl diphosphate synthase type I
VGALRDVITASGALARTEARIAELTAVAVAALRSVDLDAAGPAPLVELAGAATRRAG